ncbi:MAG: tetratricopeptide repeat protein [Acidobacteriota bacterium]|nr:tetratricopeptide repeat protein [Acidobacteriota bacterium]
MFEVTQYEYNIHFLCRVPLVMVIPMKFFFSIVTAIFFFLPGTRSVYAQSAGLEWDVFNRKVTELFLQGEYDRAGVVARKALEVAENNVGPNHPDVAASLNCLGRIYNAQGQNVQAEALYKRALTIMEATFDQNHPDVAVSLNNLGAFYNAQGQYAQAEPLFKRLLAIRERTLGPDHLELVKSLNDLAGSYSALNQFAQAVPLYERVLAIREKTLGPDHLEVAISLDNLAGIYSAQGQFAQTESLSKRALAIKVKTLSPFHPEVVTSLENLATLYRSMKRNREADRLASQASRIREDKNAIEDFYWQEANTAETYRALQRYVNTYPQGKHIQEAKARQIALLEYDEPFFLAQKKGTEEALNGFILDFPGHNRLTQAQDVILDLRGRDIVDLLNEEKIEVQSRGAGITSVTLKVRRLVPYRVILHIPIGTLFVSTNEYIQNMVTIEERNYTLDSDKLVSISLSAACANRSKGIPDENDSFDIQRASNHTELEVLMPHIKKSGDGFAVRQAAVWIVTDNADYDDLGRLVSSGRMGSLPVYFANSREIKEYETVRAMQLCDEAGIDITIKMIWRDKQKILEGLENEQLKKWLEDKRPSTQPVFLRSLYYIWGFTNVFSNDPMEAYRQGKYDILVVGLKQALEKVKKIYPSEKRDVAAILNSLAVIYNAQGEYAQAEPLFKRALAIKEATLGPKHSEVVIILNNLASLYGKQGQYVNAESLFNRSLSIWEKTESPDHPYVAQSLNSLASLYYNQSKYSEAEPLAKRALAIREKALDPHHLDVAQSLNTLAGVYRAQGHNDLAEPLHRRALAICEQKLSPDHPDVAICLNNLAMLYYEQNQYDLAEPLLKRGLEIREKALGLDHPDVAESLEKIAQLYKITGREKTAEKIEKRAAVIREMKQ